MLLTNSHDGRIAINFRLTTVRVVCQNTLALAMREERSSHIFKRAHKVAPATLRSQAEGFFQLCRKTAADVGEKFKRMHFVPFGSDQVTRLLENLLPLPPQPADVSVNTRVRAQYERRVKKINDAREGIATMFTKGWSNGLEIPPAEQTVWGALNAITAFVDHKQEIDGDRYAHILFGSGATLKQKAYKLALEQLPKN
jgi:hypothetical protein